MGALEHQWIARRCPKRQGQIDTGVVRALHQFSQMSKFRRCCMEMMAWSLSKEARAKVCAYFLSLDTDKHGTISLAELKAAMGGALHMPDEEVERAFDVLDSNCNEEICYSDFLAAMVSTKVDLDDELLRSTDSMLVVVATSRWTVSKTSLATRLRVCVLRRLSVRQDMLRTERYPTPSLRLTCAGPPQGQTLLNDGSLWTLPQMRSLTAAS